MASKTIIVMSDSHGDRDIVQAIKDKYLGQVDAIFHNGDSELKSSDPIWDGIYVVGGNCDYDAGYPDDLVTQLDNLTIAQTHGHLYHINFTWDKLDYFAQEAEADFCLYGHLHRPAAWQVGKTIFVNPGSVSQPRGEVNEKLYARIDVTDTTIRVNYFTRQHEIYPLLSKEFKR
ncbi:metallophosphoesterase [Streptococcus dysgalactiae]|uniref:Phosphoesterase n=1 Tax=Streptococcus dysgalactiae subsp. equisimilis TaxID=119602 RepID=A0A9X8XFB8_STREQ|nr:metallophosphoesterase [Streptococcus dysgalactiae]SQF66384.1 metallophosphoesterase ysnB [Streptococcus dysgalactiae subsp. equisimilis]VEF04306.1 metallophosphoesterase ysnB [Streptococcus dysgalactiae subsp. equisimilis]